jgi:hypothetical protein
MMISGGKAGIPGEPGNLEQPYVPWADDETLYDLLQKGFPTEITPEFVKDGARFPFTVAEAEIRENYFPHHFNLRDMTRLSGFKVVWTDNLFDHLFVEEDDEKEFRTKVYIFHNISLLQELEARYVCLWT